MPKEWIIPCYSVVPSFNFTIEVFCESGKLGLNDGTGFS